MGGNGRMGHARKTLVAGVALTLAGALLPALAPSAASAAERGDGLERPATLQANGGDAGATHARSTRVIVKYKPSVKGSVQAQALRARGLHVRKNLDLIHAHVVDVPEGRTASDVAAELRRDPAVVYAVPDVLRKAQGSATAPNDEFFDQQWGLRNTGQPLYDSAESATPLAGVDVDALGAWGVATGSPSVTVAVIDQGIDVTHPDLAGAMWTNPGEIAGNQQDDDGNGLVDDVHGWDFVRDTGAVDDPVDDVLHGTHVGGIIGATANNGEGVAGLASGVRLMSLKVISDGVGYDSDAIEAIAYAKSMGARVMNASWGASLADDANAANAGLRDAIAACDCVFVAAAGNDGASTNVPDNRVYPAAFNLPNRLSVAAAGVRGGLADFSNHGWTVDLAAPGEAIASTFPDGYYGWYSGTSMATPFASATAALMLGKVPTLTPADVVSTIKATVKVAGSMDVMTGGMLDAGAAMRQIVSHVPVPKRLGGRDRYVVAASVAAEFDTGVPVAYVASGEVFADALAGGALAASEDAPMLLTAGTKIPVPTAAALTRLQPGRIVVLGGPGSVSDTVKQQLDNYTNGTVTRIQGDSTYGTDRYGTAAKVALKLAASVTGQGGTVDTVYLASGQTFPDALSGAALAGSTGQPVLLTTRDRLPVGTALALNDLNPAKVVILGGSGSVSDTVMSQLAATYPSVERIGGRDRYAVAANVAARMPGATSAFVANGSVFPDALAGAALAGSLGAPVLLVARDTVPDSAATALSNLDLTSLVALGGIGSVTPANFLAMGDRFIP
jgi:subtilisin family serine protease